MVFGTEASERARLHLTVNLSRFAPEQQQ